jgi:hypothetical protein
MLIVEATEILSSALPAWLRVLVAVTVNGKVPMELGLPVIRPLLENAKPGRKLPDSVQVNRALGPFAFNVAE